MGTLASIIVLAGFVAVASATTAGATWSAPARIPGLAVLNTGRITGTPSISCPTAGNCAVAGTYTQSAPGFVGGFGQGFVADERNGSWGTAQPIPGLAALNVGGEAEVWGISCSGAGECVAWGNYLVSPHDDPNRPDVLGFLVEETGGIWGSAIPVPGLAALDVDESGWIRSVSCPSPGNCTGVGIYTDALGHGQAFVIDERNGEWGSAQPVDGLQALNLGGLAYPETVACPAVGQCSAVGVYLNASGHSELFVVDESNGVWGTAAVMPGIAALNDLGNAFGGALSCTSPGNCTAGGTYNEGSEHWHSGAFVAVESGGVWSAALRVVGLPKNVGSFAEIQSISCPAADTCEAGGAYQLRATTYNSRAFLLSESHGKWGTAQPVRGLNALDTDRVGIISGVSCGAVGSCAAVGSYASGSSEFGFVVNERSGSWGSVEPIGARDASLDSVACTSAGRCVAVGHRVSHTSAGDFTVSELTR